MVSVVPEVTVVVPVVPVVVMGVHVSALVYALPVGHASHEMAALRLRVVPAQVVQEFAPGDLYAPFPHASRLHDEALEDPVDEVVFPSGHCVQPDRRRLPPPQSVTDCVPVRYCPTGHLEQPLAQYLWQ